jgi:hypothetical protein
VESAIERRIPHNSALRDDVNLTGTRQAIDRFCEGIKLAAAICHIGVLLETRDPFVQRCIICGPCGKNSVGACYLLKTALKNEAEFRQFNGMSVQADCCCVAKLFGRNQKPHGRVLSPHCR